jgi:hypothetical protein
MTEYCCKEFEKEVDYDDFCYYRVGEDSYNSITKDGWYIRNAEYDRPIASLEPFKRCPWCGTKL